MSRSWCWCHVLVVAELVVVAVETVDGGRVLALVAELVVVAVETVGGGLAPAVGAIVAFFGR